MDVLSLVDVGLSGGIVVLTVYFFFLQSPFLFGRLGRAKFVPISGAWQILPASSSTRVLNPRKWQYDVARRAISARRCHRHAF